mmetsp:Transcript_3119/g.4679  ORF Transcript_3119/g.4679 Transcript_3119/m.4679 type:complete len:231 (+) Transcript_3119:237-929(+)
MFGFFGGSRWFSSLGRSTTRCGCSLHITSSDTAIGSSAGNRGKVQSKFRRSLLGKGRCHHTIASGYSLGYRGRLLGGRSRSRCRRCRSSRSSTSRQSLRVSLESCDVGLFLGNQRYGCTHRAAISLLGDNGSEVSVFEGLHVHIGFIALHHHNGFARRYGIPLCFKPGYDFALLHGRRQSRHVNLAELTVRRRRSSRGRRLRSRSSCSRRGSRTCSHSRNIALILYNHTD